LHDPISEHLRFQLLADMCIAPARQRAGVRPARSKQLEPQMLADGMVDASNAVGDSMDFDAGFANIEQQTQAQTTRLEVIDALRVVYAIQRRHGFQFNDPGGLNQHVSEVLSDDDVVVPDRDCIPRNF
jgi:hypothetical protein